jgi:ATP-binding cassette, subfamily F, member 3
MLNISEMTFRIGGRVLLEDASASLPTGHKVGLVGRNGTGKSTLLKLILGDLVPESGTASIPRTARIGTVAQEAPGGKETLLEVVMAGDIERTQLMAEAETAKDPNRISEIQVRLADIEAYSAESRAAVILAGLGFTEAVMNGPCSLYLAVGGCAWRWLPLCLVHLTCCCSTSRQIISILKAPSGCNLISAIIRILFYWSAMTAIC